jgi:hypothetical protein
MKQTLLEYSEKLQTVRELATHFQCAATTLKTWVKKGDLASYQEASTSAHLLNPEHVERWLRNRSHVKSVFHPNPENPSPFSFKGDSFPSIMKAAHALPHEQQRVLITSLGGHISPSDISEQ